jgi:MFS family permease
MWELYAFWAFIPVVLAYYVQHHQNYRIDISLWSFVIISAGGFACVIWGYLSNWIGAAKAAICALSVSGLCCALSPLLFHQGSALVFFVFMTIWGMTVIADSPMFSTLVAQEASPASRGTALTIVVSIGFAITILSIQLLNWLIGVIDISYVFLFLLPGPVFGLLAMMNKRRIQT